MFGSNHPAIAVLLVLTLLLCGAYAGMTLMCQIAVLPTMRRISPKTYLETWKVMDSLMDRAMPPYKGTLLIVTAITAGMLFHQHQTSLAILTSVSFLLSLLALVLTITMQLPLNAKLQSAPLSTDEQTLAAWRRQTERNFTVRFVIAVISFAVLALGTVCCPLA